MILLEIMRPANCAMAGAASLIGMIASGAPPQSLHVAALVFSAVFLITGGGNAVNDFFDREIDAVNRPERPIPSGRLSPRAALMWSVTLFVAGCAISGLINQMCMALALLNSSVLVIYAARLKGLPLAGNIAVSYLTGTTFLFGGLAAVPSSVTAFLSILSALATLSREIVKDIEDLPGDLAHGAKTLPAFIGERRSFVLASLALIMAIMLSYLVPLGIEYMATVSIANLAFLVSVNRMLRGDASGSQRCIKIGMALALLAFMLGSLV
ncbi:MAG: geranylgeranylglycerol-phosphate geranylgeranyltransferase [Methanothrix sp.]|uniref:geranylgeranylglycerol-phosphate geranylgeranyltransferase n=1 Tax=Methanothrix sp. TaxID=90426 RepID=UPI003168370A|nr:geranylgeranylglycerol-phosphate geranylgeranyltransferase [Methanothrix sp.]